MSRVWPALGIALACGCAPAADGPGAPEVVEGLDPYEVVFDDAHITEVALAIDDADLERILADPFSREYVPATLTYGGHVVEEVGVRLKGNLQVNFWVVNGGYKFAFKIDVDRFVEDQEFMGLTKLNLHCAVNDPSFLRENAAYHLLREAGIPASRASYVHLTVNGIDHGVYNVVEQVDRRWLADRFDDDGGNLYKPLDGSFLEYLGDDPADYDLESYNLQTNTEDPDHARLLELIRVLGHPDEPGFPEDIEALFDVDGFLRFLALNTFILNLDSYAEIGHNYYLYDDPGSGRFVFIPWDMSEAFGNFACWPEEELMMGLDVHHPMCAEERPLISNLLGVQRFRDAYLAHLEQLMGEGVLEHDALVARLEQSHAFVDAAVEADPARFYSYEEFLANLTDNVPNRAEATAAPPEIYGMIHLVDERTRIVSEQLAEPWEALP